MVITKTRVQSGDVISAALMNDILDQLEKIQGGTPTDLAQILSRLQQLESWKAAVDPQVGKVNGIDARLSVAESSVTSLSGLSGNVTTLQQSLAALAARVATLESQIQATGKVRIGGFDPPGSVPVGQVFTIIGAGFKPTLTQNLVFVNEIPVYNFRLDSDATHLSVVMPLTIPGVTPVAAGADVTIRVSNSDGEAQRTYDVTPALAVSGTPPKITKVYRDTPNRETVLAAGENAIIEGQGLGTFNFNPTLTHKPAVTVIYQTNNGPVTYNVPDTDVEFLYQGSTENVPVRFRLPYILEGPIATPFNVLLKVSFGNHVPALAQVTIQKAS